MESKNKEVSRNRTKVVVDFMNEVLLQNQS